MQMLYQIFCQFILCMIDDIIDTTEVINCLYNVIHIYSAVSNTNRISFKNISSLIVGKLATFYMIRVGVEFYSKGQSF